MSHEPHPVEGFTEFPIVMIRKPWWRKFLDWLRGKVQPRPLSVDELSELDFTKFDVGVDFAEDEKLDSGWITDSESNLKHSEIPWHMSRVAVEPVNDEAGQAGVIPPPLVDCCKEPVRFCGNIVHGLAIAAFENGEPQVPGDVLERMRASRSDHERGIGQSVQTSNAAVEPS